MNAATITESPFTPLARRVWRQFLRVKLALVDRGRYERVVLEEVGGIQLVVLPDVFNPKLLRSGEFLVATLAQFSPRGRVLDLGCGSGAAGIFAARSGCDVVAVDINPSAVRCTRINSLLNDVNVDVRHGDLFEPVETERFDLVTFNPPYYRGVPRNALDHAWRAPDMPGRFAASLASHLTPTGSALLVLSSDGEPAAFIDALGSCGFKNDAVATRDFVNEIMTVYQVRPC